MKLIALFAAILICPALQAQDIPASEVPSAVQNAFKAKFPTAKDLEWEKQGARYEAEFHIDRIDHKAILSATGQLEKHKRNIRTDELPQAIRDAISTGYKDYRIDDAERLEKGGNTFYQVELDGEPQDQKLVFTKEGKVENGETYW